MLHFVYISKTIISSEVPVGNSFTPNALYNTIRDHCSSTYTINSKHQPRDPSKRDQTKYTTLTGEKYLNKAPIKHRSKHTNSL